MSNRIKIDCISEGCQIIKNRINRILNLDSQAFELRLELTPPPFLGLQFADGRLWDFSALIITWASTDRANLSRKHSQAHPEIMSYQLSGICCSVAKLCLTLCHPVDYSVSGFPALHYHSEFPQTHVHWVGNLFSSVQWLSRVRLFVTPWIAACQASLSITNSWSSLKLMRIELVMPSSHLILGRPLLLLPPIPPSIRVFSNESTHGNLLAQLTSEITITGRKGKASKCTKFFPIKEHF